MKVGDAGLDLCASEDLEGANAILAERSAIEYILCAPYGVWPEVDRDGDGPAEFGIEPLGASHVLDISDSFFGHAVLEVGIDCTEGDGLPLSCYISQPDSFGKAPKLSAW